MADVGGGIAGGLCAGLCGAVVEALQFSWLNQSSAGIGCCKCCDIVCRCKCCWDAGEFDPNDFPEQSKANELQTKAEQNNEDTLPAYSKAQEMKVPETSESNPNTDTVIQSSNLPHENVESSGTEIIGATNTNEIAAVNQNVEQTQQVQK